MKNHFRSFLILIFAAAAAYAQTGPAASSDIPRSGIPRMPDGKPDLTGVWDIPYVPDMSRGIGALPFTPWGEADFKAYDAAKFDYTGHCLPAGLTRQMNTPMPLEVFQMPKRVALLWEAWNTFVVIPTDGRGHPPKVDPTWMGNSVGHWEGDWLVVDSIGFNDKTRLDTIGHPHSDQLHVIQRFTAIGRPAHGLRSDSGRSEGVHQALDQQARLHAEADVGADGIFVRGKQ